MMFPCRSSRHSSFQTDEDLKARVPCRELRSRNLHETMSETITTGWAPDPRDPMADTSPPQRVPGAAALDFA